MDTLFEHDLPLMTAEEFLAADLRAFGDGRFELVDGRVVAMAPPSLRHRVIQGRVYAALLAAFAAAGVDCEPVFEPRVRIMTQRARVRSPDIVVMCGRPGRPKVLFEILSPSNKGQPYQERLRDLRLVDNADEVIELAQDEVFARVLRRVGNGWLSSEVRGEEEAIDLRSVGVGVRLGEFYRNLPGAAEELS